MKTYLIQLYLSVEDISHLSLHILQHVLEQMLLFCIVANNLLSTSITILLIDWQKSRDIGIDVKLEAGLRALINRTIVENDNDKLQW